MMRSARLPAVCLAAAPLSRALLRRAWPRRVLLGYLALMALALLGAGAVLGLDLMGVAARVSAERALAPPAVHHVAFTLMLMGAGIALLGTACRRRPVAALLASTLVLWTGHGLALAPALNPSSSGRALMQSVARRLPAGAELGLVAWTEQQLLHAPPGTRDFGFEAPVQAQWTRAAEWAAAAPGLRWVMAEAGQVPACIAGDGVLSAGRSNRRSYLLIPGTVMHAGGCRR